MWLNINLIIVKILIHFILLRLMLEGNTFEIWINKISSGLLIIKFHVLFFRILVELNIKLLIKTGIFKGLT